MEKQEFYFQWHINNNCNLRCRHCYQTSYELSSLDFSSLLHIKDEIVKSLNKWNMLGRVSLTGGEPFMSPHLFPLLEILEGDENITEIGILTNGTLVRDEHIDRLTQLKKLREVQVSLDGATPETHEATRGPNSYARAVDAIRKLREAHINVAVMFTLTKRNMAETVQMIDFCEDHDVNALTVERVTPCGNTSVDETLTPDELKRTYSDVTIRANKIRTCLRVRRTRSLWVLTTHLCDDENSILGGFCPVGLTSLTIMHDGTVLPCRRLNIPIGNLLKENMFHIWYGSDVLWKIRDKANLSGKCGSCENIALCGGCRAIAYELTGDYMGEDIQCWM